MQLGHLGDGVKMWPGGFWGGCMDGRRGSRIREYEQLCMKKFGEGRKGERERWVKAATENKLPEKYVLD